KPPVVLQYDDSSYGYQDPGTQQITTGVTDLDVHDGSQLYAGDFNHDGRDDLLYYSSNARTVTNGLWLKDYFVRFATGPNELPGFTSQSVDTFATPCAFVFPSGETTQRTECFFARMSLFDSLATGYRDSLFVKTWAARFLTRFSLGDAAFEPLA